MSGMPNLTNNLIQPQNIVTLNQMGHHHTIMNTNMGAASNGGVSLPTAMTGISHVPQQQQNVVDQHQPVTVNDNTVPMQVGGAPATLVHQVQPQQQQQQQQQVVHHQAPPVAQPPPPPPPVVMKSSMQQNSIGGLAGASSSEGAQVLTKQRLQDLVRDTDSALSLEDDAEELILSYVDDFVNRSLEGAALIAKNRHVNTIEVKDLQQILNRNYRMWTPGFGTDELRPFKRSLTTEAHKQRLALIRKAIKKY